MTPKLGFSTSSKHKTSGPLPSLELVCISSFIWKLSNGYGWQIFVSNNFEHGMSWNQHKWHHIEEDLFQDKQVSPNLIMYLTRLPYQANGHFFSCLNSICTQCHSSVCAHFMVLFQFKSHEVIILFKRWNFVLKWKNHSLKRGKCLIYNYYDYIFGVCLLVQKFP